MSYKSGSADELPPPPPLPQSLADIAPTAGLVVGECAQILCQHWPLCFGGWLFG
jgi:hypothetical protein